MDQIDAFIYINLDSRKDRKEHIDNQLLLAKIPLEKIHRLSATKHEKGSLGCAISHSRALNLIIENCWKRTIIFEDDFIWNDLSAIDKVLGEAVNSNPDVFLLSMSKTRKFHKYYDSLNKTSSLMRVNFSQTTSGYYISQNYAPILLNCFIESIQRHEKGETQKTAAIDILWTKLQPHSLWLTSVPCLGYQVASFSDIENRLVNYRC